MIPGFPVDDRCTRKNALDEHERLTAGAGDRDEAAIGLLPAPGGDVGDAVDRDRSERAVRHRDQEEPPTLVEVLVHRLLHQVPGEQRQIRRLVGLLGVDEQELADLAAVARGEQRRAIDVAGRHLSPVFQTQIDSLLLYP